MEDAIDFLGGRMLRSHTRSFFAKWRGGSLTGLTLKELTALGRAMLKNTNQRQNWGRHEVLKETLILQNVSAFTLRTISIMGKHISTFILTV